jgi:hypothetical protein
LSAIDIIPLIISTLALLTSGGTAWFTLLRRGTVKMTQPTVIFFGPDGHSKRDSQKIFLRTLVFSTAKRNHIIESMFVRLQHGKFTQDFNIWVYGDKDMARGSGISVGEQGVVCNHHFLLLKDGDNYPFSSGEYTLQIFAKILNQKKPLRLFQQTLSISIQEAEVLKRENVGIYFDWIPDSAKYHSHVEITPVGEQLLVGSLLKTSQK